MTKKLLFTAAVVLASAGMSQTALAQGNSNRQEEKVTLCHRTNSVKNPYVKITVDQSAVDGNEKSDHFGEHKGPIATSEAVAQQLKNDKTEWGDIIPPVEGVHEGLNWTAEGQAIFNNDCKFAQQQRPNQPVRQQDGTTPGQTLGGRTTRGGGAGAGAQVESPVGGVQAGAGGMAGSVAGSLFGLGSSLAALAYGALRLRKNG